MTSETPFLPDALLDLPFDQYTRHRLVALLAATVRRHQVERSLRVLDVGGYPCLTSQFLPDDQVTVIDILAVPGAEAGSYLRADGAALPFRDHAFDLVVSLDSLEHVPGERRAAYVDELLRVSRGYVLLVAPFASEAVILAERVLAEFVRVVNREEQPQLREHRAYGWPALDEWQRFVSNRGAAVVAFSSGYVYSWLPMMLLKHFVISLPDPDGLHHAIDRFYNATLQQLDSRAPGYRHGLVISTAGPSPVLDEMAKLLEPTGAADRLEIIERMEQLGLLMKAAELHVASRRDDRLRDELRDKDRHILNLEAALRDGERTLAETRAAAEARVDADRARAEALATRVQGLEAHVAALRQGRVMRTLDVIQRLRGRVG